MLSWPLRHEGGPVAVPEHAPDGGSYREVVVASIGIFALGETLLSPIAPAITNDLAPEHLRGRYNAAGSLAFQVAAIAAPTSAGFLIGHDMPVTYVARLLAGSAALGVLSLRMERVLPPAANGLHVDAADLGAAEGLTVGAPAPAASS